MVSFLFLHAFLSSAYGISSCSEFGKLEAELLPLLYVCTPREDLNHDQISWTTWCYAHSHKTPNHPSNRTRVCWYLSCLYSPSPICPCSHWPCAGGVWSHMLGGVSRALGKPDKSQYVSAPQRCFGPPL